MYVNNSYFTIHSNQVYLNFLGVGWGGLYSDPLKKLIISSLCHFQTIMQISSKSICNFLSFLANKQTNKLWQIHNLGGSNNLFYMLNSTLHFPSSPPGGQVSSFGLEFRGREFDPSPRLNMLLLFPSLVTPEISWLTINHIKCY